MAMRILASRLVQQTQANGVPLRVCSASMSSSSKAPATTSAPKTPATMSKKTKSSRESLRSLLAMFTGGKWDPADPKDGPIDGKKVNFPDYVEHATGEEKLFLLAFENGIVDPYCTFPVERDEINKGTKEAPVQIESFTDSRLVACSCEPTQSYVRYTWVHKGEPKRCNCGYWLKCVDAPRFWEKIPKQDLLDIPFFRDLEEDGKLDKFLETGVIDDPHYPKLGQAL